MADLVNRQLVLKRPVRAGMPVLDDFALVESPLPVEALFCGFRADGRHYEVVWSIPPQAASDRSRSTREGG